MHEKQQACARKNEGVRKEGAKEGHKKGGALQKGNAQEIKREIARERESIGAKRCNEKASTRV